MTNYLIFQIKGTDITPEQSNTDTFLQRGKLTHWHSVLVSVTKRHKEDINKTVEGCDIKTKIFVCAENDSDQSMEGM